MTIIIIQNYYFFLKTHLKLFLVGEKMTDEVKCLKILKDETSLKDIFKEELNLMKTLES